LDSKRRLVDLPGYGYAKVPEHVKHQWHKDMNEYFERRECLKGAVLVMDVRHPLKPFDQMMLDWCVNSNIPVHIILTKSDKLKRGAASNAHLKVKREVKRYPSVTVQLFSSLKKQGLESLWGQLDIFFEINT
jgi:GTP-binding protein